MPVALPSLVSHPRSHSDWLPFGMVAAYGFAASVATFFLTVHFKENLGFSGVQIGLLFAVGAVTGVVASLPAGLGNDRLTSRNLILYCLVLQTLCFALLGWLQAFTVCLLVYFGWGVSSAALKLSLDVQVLKTDTGERTGARVGLYQAWRFAGVGAGTVASGYLLLHFDFAHTLWAAAGCCLLLIGPALALPATPIGRVRLADYRADLRDRRVLLFALWMFAFSSHWGAEATCYGLFLRTDFGLDLAQMGWYMLAEYAAVASVVLLAGPRIRAGAQLRTAALLGLVASGLGHLGMVLQPVGLSVAFRVLHGVGDGLMFLVFYVGIARLFAVERLGGNTGFVAMCTMLGYVVGSLVYSPIGESLGYAVPLVASGLVNLALAAPVALTRMEWHPR